ELPGHLLRPEQPVPARVTGPRWGRAVPGYTTIQERTRKEPPMGASYPHEMVHEGTDASAMEEWRCPACGRHFVVRWPPDYERLVLAEGDPRATHVGTKGEVGLTGLGGTLAPGGGGAK